MPQFDAQFMSSNLFWTVVSFVILLVLLRRYALPGIMEVMESRQDRIRNDLESAERLRLEADRLRAENEAQLAQAKSAADEVIARAQERATAMLAENEEKMKQEAARILAEAQRALEREREQAVTEIRALAGELAVTAAGKFVAASLDDDTRMRLVDESLEQLQGRLAR